MYIDYTWLLQHTILYQYLNKEERGVEQIKFKNVCQFKIVCFNNNYNKTEKESKSKLGIGKYQTIVVRLFL